MYRAVAIALANARRQHDLESIAAAESSPLRRMHEPPLKLGRIFRRAKAVANRARRQIDVHVPLERAVVEPREHLHRDLVKRERDLIREVSIDLEDDAHSLQEHFGNESQAARASG